MDTLQLFVCKVKTNFNNSIVSKDTTTFYPVLKMANDTKTANNVSKETLQTRGHTLYTCKFSVLFIYWN